MKHCVNQVYENPYLLTIRNHQNCWIVFKTKVRSRFHISISDGEVLDLNEGVFQEV